MTVWAAAYTVSSLMALPSRWEPALSLVRGDVGIAFPRQEDSNLAAITVSPEPAGEKLTLGTVKAYATGTIGKSLCGQTDDGITDTLVHEMKPVRRALMLEDATPTSTHIQRWPEALPMFEAGHFKKLSSFKSGEIENPGQALVFAGDYIGGPFIEGAFTSGLEAAKRLDARLRRAGSRI